MPRTVTARFASEEEAERALAAISAEVPLRDSAVIGSGPAGALTLDSLQLTPEERSACEAQVAKGGYLLVAQVASESRGAAVLRLLGGISGGGAPEGAAAPAPAPAPAAEAAPPPPPAPERRVEAPEAVAAPLAAAAAATVEEEERIPIVEEELRIGKREVVRGRSRVHTHIAEIPVQEDVELLHEETRLERRPVNRRLTEEEVAEGGLLQERVIEITEMREEAVVTKEAFVREELVVTKSVHRRVERIEETVRRTEVETERLEPETAAAGGGGRADGR
ncbi:MAG TPA: YsnF/AvaK domain-containing protein [Allosphingosinicella sp.]|jgi:stress response protein YsnF